MRRWNLRKALALATIETLKFGQATTPSNIKRHVIPELTSYGHNPKRNKIRPTDIKTALDIIWVVMWQKPVIYRYSIDLLLAEERRDAILNMTEEQFNDKMLLRKGRKRRE